jgi:hypothetical protein
MDKSQIATLGECKACHSILFRRKGECPVCNREFDNVWYPNQDYENDRDFYTEIALGSAKGNEHRMRIDRARAGRSVCSYCISCGGWMEGSHYFCLDCEFPVTFLLSNVLIENEYRRLPEATNPIAFDQWRETFRKVTAQQLIRDKWLPGLFQGIPIPPEPPETISWSKRIDELLRKAGRR